MNKFDILDECLTSQSLAAWERTCQQDEQLSPPAEYSETGAIFVATNGNDHAGDGSLSNPFKTIQHALDGAQADATIIVRGGLYRETGEVRIRQPRITICSKINEWAIIEAPIDNEDTHAMVVYWDVESSGGRMQRLEIIGGYYYGIKMETKWDWGDPADRSGASQIIIEDCIVHDTGRDCIKITPNCDDIAIRRCEIFHSGIGPANSDAQNAEGIDNVNGDRMQVQDCYIHDIYSTGVYFKGGATDCVVERCKIDQCGDAGIRMGFDTSPEYFDLQVNPLRYECINSIVRNCIISETGHEGIGFFAARDSRALNNTLINNALNEHAVISLFEKLPSGGQRLASYININIVIG